MLTVSLFIKTIKKYANNISVSDETFFRDFFQYFIDAFQIKNRLNEDFYFNKSTISAIMSQKEDISPAMRDAICKYSAPPRVESAMEAFVEDYINPSRIDAAIANLQEIVTTDAALSDKAKQEIVALQGTACIAKVFIEAIKMPNIPLPATKVLWQQGENSLNLITNDIIKIAFSKDATQSQKIVVIPVNSTFETKVTVNPEDDIYPLVSENTIHGKWLVNILKDISREELDTRIDTYLARTGAQPVGNCVCPGGKSVQYAIGDTVVLQHKQTLFYLIAISDFDTRNKAHSSKELIEKAIVRLLERYDDVGQGYKLYLPLLGTGKSRANLTPKQSYELIRNVALNNQQIINGEINIVVLHQMAHELI